MRHKLTLLFALVLCALGWQSVSATPEYVVPAETLKTWTYKWAPNGGTDSVEAYYKDAATDPYQIYDMLRAVYMDKRLPGPFTSAYNANKETEDPVYYGGMLDVWNIPGTSEDQYRPSEEGYTVVLIEVYDELTTYRNTSSSKSSNYTPQYMPYYIETKAELITYIKNNIKSARVMVEAMRIGEGENAGTVFNTDATLNRFFFLGKGQARKDGYYAVGASEWSAHQSNYDGTKYSHCLPFDRMFEEFSPTSGAQGDEITDYYSKMSQGVSYPVIHDCASVIEAEHFFCMSGKTGTDAQSMTGLNFFIPDYRLLYFKDYVQHYYYPDKYDGSVYYLTGYIDDGRYMNMWGEDYAVYLYDKETGTYADEPLTTSEYTYSRSFAKWAVYNTKHQPKTMLYYITLKDSVTQINENDCAVKVWWTSSLDELAGETVKQEYTLYEIVYDPDGNVVEKVLVGKTTGTEFYDTVYNYTVDRYDESYVIEHYVEATPVVEEGYAFATTTSNTDQVIIPGKNPRELYLKVDHYESDYVAKDVERNYYRNHLRIYTDPYTPLTVDRLKDTNDIKLWRRGSDGSSENWSNLTLTKSKLVDVHDANGNTSEYYDFAIGDEKAVGPHAIYEYQPSTTETVTAKADYTTCTGTAATVTYTGDGTWTTSGTVNYGTGNCYITGTNGKIIYTLPNNYKGTVKVSIVADDDSYDYYYFYIVVNGTPKYISSAGTYTWDVSASDGTVTITGYYSNGSYYTPNMASITIEYEDEVSTGGDSYYTTEELGTSTTIDGTTYVQAGTIYGFAGSDVVDLSAIDLVDEFNVSVANNNHPEWYRYDATMFFGTDADRDSIYFATPGIVPVYKSQFKLGGYYTEQEVASDAVYNKIKPYVLNAEVNVDLDDNSAIRFVTLERGDNQADEGVYNYKGHPSFDALSSTVTLATRDNSIDYFTHSLNGTYLQYSTQDTVKGDTGTFLDLWNHSCDANTLVFTANGSGYSNDSLTYVPVIWTPEEARARGAYNTYGADIKTTAVGQVAIQEMSLTKPAETEWLEYWSVDGTKYTTFSLTATVLAAVPKLANVKPNWDNFEPYMYRVWVKNNNNLREFTTDENGKRKDAGAVTDSYLLLGTFLVADMDETTDPLNPTLGSMPTRDADDKIVIPDDYMVFGGKASDDYQFVVRFYYKRNETASASNRAPMLGDANSNSGRLYNAAENTWTQSPVTAVYELSYDSNVVSTTYYNMQGMQSSTPFEGVNIVVTRYSDGTTRTVKVVK